MKQNRKLLLLILGLIIFLVILNLHIIPWGLSFVETRLSRDGILDPATGYNLMLLANISMLIAAAAGSLYIFKPKKWIRIVLYALIIEMSCLFFVLLIERNRLNGDTNPINWFQSVFLLAGSVLAGTMWITLKDDKRKSLFWALVSLGFLFLALDEALCFHEFLGRSIKSMYPAWYTLFHTAYADNIVVLSYLIFSIIFLLAFRTTILYYVKKGKSAWMLFICAVFLFGLAVISDYFIVNEFESYFEEIAEFTASTLFAASFTVGLCEEYSNNKNLFLGPLCLSARRDKK